MGRKVNPTIFRIGINKKCDSVWFSSKDYAELLEQDLKLKKFLKTKFKDAGVSRVEIERIRNKINITIFAGKPGFIIGRNGVGVEDLIKEINKKFIEKFTSKTAQKYIVSIEVKEVEQPGLDAQITLQGVVADIEKRIPFRRALKQAIGKVERAGGQGVKITISGRLNGSEIARSETLRSGKLPLQTLRANIDYTRGVARTIFGAIGVKVWIYKGTDFKKA
jgi:small subunit ribosomal protein S3